MAHTPNYKLCNELRQSDAEVRICVPLQFGLETILNSLQLCMKIYARIPLYSKTYEKYIPRIMC